MEGLYYNKYHKDPNESDESCDETPGDMDGIFRFEKRMK